MNEHKISEDIVYLLASFGLLHMIIYIYLIIMTIWG